MKKFMLMMACAMLLLSGCGNADSKSGNADAPNITEQDLIQLSEVKTGDTLAVMNTNKGTITIRLFPEQAPKAVENFTTHAKNGYYDGVTFHRIIQDFMIQGGDPEGTGRGGESIWGKPFENEESDQLYHFRGALSMANAGKDTNGSQFFIVQNSDVSAYTDEVYAKLDKKSGHTHADIVKETYSKLGGTPDLDYGYSVFGQVIEGMDVVDTIAAVPTGANDKPTEDVIIESITVKTAE